MTPPQNVVRESESYSAVVNKNDDHDDYDDCDAEIKNERENEMLSHIRDESETISREYRQEDAQYGSSSNIMLLAFAFTAVFMSSGLIFGWPTLVYQLPKTLSNHQLDYVYTVGSCSAQASNFVFGLIRDSVGTRLTTCLVLLCSVIGCLALALSDNNVNGFAVSMFFLGCGTSVKLCLQPVADLFPAEYHGIILSSISGAFQMSGLIMSLFASFDEDKFSLLIGFYCIPLLGLILIAFVMLPQGMFFGNENDTYAIPTQSQDLPSSFSSPAVRNEAEYDDISNNEEKNEETEPSEIWIDVSDLDFNEDTYQDEYGFVQKFKGIPTTLKDVLYSMDYILLVSWFSFQVIPSQYYIGTIGYHFKNENGDDDQYGLLFSFIFASSALTAPSIGNLADTFGLVPLHLYASIVPSLSLFTLSFNSYFWNLFGMFVFSVGRIMVFNAFYIHIAKRYKFKYYGTLVGVGCLVSAITGLLQYPLITKAHSGQQILVNYTLGFAMIIQGIPYCFWLKKRIQDFSEREIYANNDVDDHDI